MTTPAKQLHEVTQLIISCWSLSDGERAIPTSHGVLDRALQSACTTGAFPEWVHTRLNFVDSRIGLQCVELPAILDWAQRAELTTAPNPSYRTTQVQVSQMVAQHLIRKLGVDPEQARAWGNILRSAVSTAKDEAETREISAAEIEDY